MVVRRRECPPSKTRLPPMVKWGETVTVMIRLIVRLLISPLVLFPGRRGLKNLITVAPLWRTSQPVRGPKILRRPKRFTCRPVSRRNWVKLKARGLTIRTVLII